MKRKEIIIVGVIASILLVVLLIMLIKPNEITPTNSSYKSSVTNSKVEKENDLSFFQCIKQKVSPEIVVIGDLISMDDSRIKGNWETYFTNTFNKNYKISPKLSYVLGINHNTVSGWANLQEDSKIKYGNKYGLGGKYNMAIICLGTYDDDAESMKVYYESIIRILVSSNNKMEIVLVNPHNLKNKDDKRAQVIKDLASYYNCIYVDMAKAFTSSKAGYSKLIANNIQANNKGLAVYSENIYNSIKNIKDKPVSSLKKPLNNRVQNMNSKEYDETPLKNNGFIYADKAFASNKVDSFLEFQTKKSEVLMEVAKTKLSGKIKVSVDGKLLKIINTASMFEDKSAVYITHFGDGLTHTIRLQPAETKPIAISKMITN